MSNRIRIRHLNDPEFFWVPDHVRYPSARLNLQYTPSPGAVQRFGSPDRLDYRDFIGTCPAVSGERQGGYCDPDRYPYQPFLMELLDHPLINDLTILAPNQSAKTTTVENWLLRRAKYDPVDSNIYYPDRDTVVDRFKNSLIVKLKDDHFIDLLTSCEDDLTGKLIKLASGMLIRAGWTSSLLKMSSVSAGVVILEECDKVKEQLVATEAAVEYLIKGRGVDYGKNFKIIRCTTVSSEMGMGWRAAQRANAYFDHLARCPHCKKLEYMSPDRVHYVQDRSLFKKISSTPAFAWYFCGQCGAKWTDEHRITALRAGEVRARLEGWQDLVKDGADPVHDLRPIKKYLDEENPGTGAISIPSLCLPTVSLCSWVADKIAGDNDSQAKQYFYNHHLSKPWNHLGRIRKPEHILQRTWGQPFGVVPSGWQCAGLYCGIDSQQGSFYYWVSAIGFSQQADGTKIRPMIWQVDAGQLESVDEAGRDIPIEQVLQVLEDRRYQDELENTSWPGDAPFWVRNTDRRKIRLGGEYEIRMFVIDGRGNNSTNSNITDSAKRWCADKPSQRRLYWGEGMSAGKLFSAKKDENDKIWIYHTDRSQLEKMVEKGLDKRPGDPGSILVSSDCEPWMAEHLANVQLSPRSGRYVKPERGRCDIRDCLRMSILGYRIEGMDKVIQMVERNGVYRMAD